MCIVNDHVSGMKKMHRVIEMMTRIGTSRSWGKEELFPTIKTESVIKAYLAGSPKYHLIGRRFSSP